MIVGCPSCSARYQLADSKIKASGTKVRCPRCSHTFSVFPEAKPEKAELTDQSDSFIKRSGISEKKPPPTQARVSEDDHDFDPFNEKTQVSARNYYAEVNNKGFVSNKIEKKPEPEAAPAAPPKEYDTEEEITVKRRGSKNAPKKEEPEEEATRVSPSEDFNIPIRESEPDDETAASIKSKQMESDDEELFEETSPQSSADSKYPAANEDDFKATEEQVRPDFATAESHDSEAPEPAFFSEDAEDSEVGPVQPFGNATLLEIQKASGGKRRLRLKFPKKLVYAAAALFAIGGAGYLFYNLVSKFEFSSPKAEFEDLIRPAGWYQDDPASYQDALTQLAAMPKKEQEDLGNRALLAEALILNGLLTGANEQVLDGVSFATSLSIREPKSPHGFYGISAYAIWNNDRRMMKDLIDRWPESYKSESEYKLLNAYYLGRMRKHEESFKLMKDLITSKPEFQRANDFGLLIALQNYSLAQRIFGQDLLDRMRQKYTIHRNRINKLVPKTPRLFADVDRLLEKVISSPAPEPKPRAAEKTPEPEPQEEAQIVKKPSPPVPTKSAEVKRAPAKPKAAPKPAKRAGPTDRLPKPSPALIAKRNEVKQNESAAQKLFRAGNSQFDKGDLDQALKSYRDALKANPEYADVYKKIGQIYMKKNESDRARRSFKIYLQLNPQSSDKKVVEDWISSLQ